MRRIVVPTDFSEASRIAVGHGVEVAEALGAELLLLHVVDETIDAVEMRLTKQVQRTRRASGSMSPSDMPR